MPAAPAAETHGTALGSHTQHCLGAAGALLAGLSNGWVINYRKIKHVSPSTMQGWARRCLAGVLNGKSSHSQLWSPQHRTDMELMDWGQGRPQK